MTIDKSESINGTGDQPVTQGEFSTMMTAIKENLDQLATQENLEQVRNEMATKADLAKLQQTTEQILELIQGIDQKMKPLHGLPERMERIERAIFH